MAEAYSEIGTKGEVRAALTPKGVVAGAGRGQSSSCPLDRMGGPRGRPLLFQDRKLGPVSFAKAGQIAHHE